MKNIPGDLSLWINKNFYFGSSNDLYVYVCVYKNIKIYNKVI